MHASETTHIHEINLKKRKSAVCCITIPFNLSVECKGTVKSGGYVNRGIAGNNSAVVI